jgi:hypothetical protein
MRKKYSPPALIHQEKFASTIRKPGRLYFGGLRGRLRVFIKTDTY